MIEPTSAAERPGGDKVFAARKWLRDWLWKTDTRDIYDGPIIPEISSLMSLAVASAIAAKDAEIQRLRERVAELERQEKYLREACSRQATEIENIGYMADAVERLRDIGNVTGCDHVDSSGGRRQLVNCVEQVLTAAEAENARLREQVEALKQERVIRDA